MKYVHKLDAMQSGTLAPDDFGHLDHIGVDFIAIERFGPFEAMSIMARGIKEIASKANAPTKYNATVTMASVSLIAERMEMADYRSAEDFIDINADLMTKAFLVEQYDDQRLNDPKLRMIPLLPKVQF
ncbi:MAG: hypothetical protein GKR98_11760 [Boseongicola sp.]|nr:MAG: hypothetical protein GKR98_11760 [Boseongicola sp.]